MRIVLSIAALAVGAVALTHGARAADSVSPPLDSIDQRVLACAPCHGQAGRATSDGYYPRIAGKPAGYLFNELLNFRDGRRNYPMMTYLTERQRDDYLREIAEYFAAQRLPYPAPQPARVDATVLERGRALVTHGDPQQNIPSCSACHGERLIGVAPAVPGLLGLSNDYLAAQLGAWRSGSRQAQAPDCMAEIVRRMKPGDLNAVAAWLSSQPAPSSEAAPAASFEGTPPLTCGSIQNTERTP
jgi:cytochrome c553